MTKQLLSAIKLITLAIILTLGLSFAYAWVGPTAQPPTANVSAPINVGATTQTKVGGDICTTVSGVTKCLQAGGGAGDNLGDHTATQTLNMAGNNISNANSVNSSILNFKGVGGDSGQAPNYYGIYQEAGPWTYPYPDLKIGFHTGIKYDAYYGYGGHRFFTGYDGSGNPAGETMSIGNGDQNVRVTNTLYANDVCTTGGKCLSQAGTHGSARFLTSSSWTAPAGVTTVFLTAAGGGGGGGGSTTWYGACSGFGGGSGGGGAFAFKRVVGVTPGTTYTILVGAGGAGGPPGTTNALGGTGGASGISGVYAVAGGTGGNGPWSSGGCAGYAGTGGAGDVDNLYMGGTVKGANGSPSNGTSIVAGGQSYASSGNVGGSFAYGQGGQGAQPGASTYGTAGNAGFVLVEW